jgi:hypothetical protein
MFWVPVVLSTGWFKTVCEFVVPPAYVFLILVAIARLRDTQGYREQAALQRKMNQRGADATYMPGLHRTKAIAFAKRVFGGPKSD